MIFFPWQLEKPLDAIVFDCDGTLSIIEGIDELASVSNVSEPVAALTALAMGTTGINPVLYQKRLDLVRPRHDDVIALGKEYFSRRVPDSAEVIALFKRLNKSVYLISAGLDPAVKIFGEKLKIPDKNIFSVGIQFDDHGNYLDFDRDSPLTRANGKQEIVAKLKNQHADMAYIGDGLNDLPVLDLVTRFIGFGGAYFRQNIADLCHFYIRSLTLSPLLPLLLTPAEADKLFAEEKLLYVKGLALINQAEVIIK